MPVSNKQIIRAVKRIAKIMGRTAGELVRAADDDWYPRKGTLMLFLRANTRDYCLVIADGGSWTTGTTLFRGTKAEIVKLSDAALFINALRATRKMKKLKGSRIRIW